MSECVFCELIESSGPFLHTGKHAVAFVPLNPVVKGHLLVVPREHAPVLWELDEEALRYTMNDVAGIAQTRGPCNIIQSNGPAATQTVQHVHFHIVPRRPNDGLKLPWSDTEGNPSE